MANKNKKLAEYYDSRTHTHQPIVLGTPVLVQNKHLKRNMNKWTLSGCVVEVLPYRQYKVKMDGSGRITRRNRRHLRPITSSVKSQVPFLKPKKSSRDISRNIVTSPAGNANCNDNALPLLPVSSDAHSLNRSIVSPSIPNRSSTSQVRPGRIPRALSNLADYTKPGVKWHPLNSTRRPSVMP